jgi:carboxypeptidase Taq
MEAIDRLRQLLGEVVDLNAAQAVLSWDQETHMPGGGLNARAQQLATLGKLAHERFISDEVGRLLEELAPLAAELDADSDQARLIQVARRDFDKATRLPTTLVAELARTTAVSQQAWKGAREDSDFARLRPHLEHVVDLLRRKAEALGYEETPYDALLDEYEPGMRTVRVEAVFAALREDLVPIVQAIAENPVPDDSFLHQEFDEQGQWEFGLRVARDFGFDLERGRQDRSAHPFSTSFSINDVRITTRVQSNFLPSCLFGTLHEAGHAMYEQGVDAALERTLLASGTSLGMHESQSRLWENLVGRSRPFWSYYYGLLQSAFPAQLGVVPLDPFYRAINKVEPSLIRVEADEVTYNLHIMLRFELETALLSGDLAVADLPEAWNEKSRDYLGMTPTDDASGVLQDIHWSAGLIGYFPTYALGNLISAQLYERATLEINGLEGQIARGQFSDLLSWLREHIHRPGRKFTASELLQRTVGSDLDAGAWLSYVRHKFGGLYDL